jgi:hypothetical protein
MNKLQQVATAINGSGDGINYKTMGAKDTYYYELQSEVDKKEHIERYAENVLNIYLDKEEIKKVYNFLETKTEGQNEYFYLLRNLK